MNLTGKEANELLKKADTKKDARAQFKGILFEIAYASLVARNADLEKFVRKMFQMSSWPHLHRVASEDLQEAATACNILTPETRFKPCGEGITFLRKAKFLTEAKDENC